MQIRKQQIFGCSLALLLNVAPTMHSVEWNFTERWLARHSKVAFLCFWWLWYILHISGSRWLSCHCSLLVLLTEYGSDVPSSLVLVSILISWFTWRLPLTGWPQFMCSLRCRSVWQVHWFQPKLPVLVEWCSLWSVDRSFTYWSDGPSAANVTYWALTVLGLPFGTQPETSRKFLLASATFGVLVL